MVDVKVTLHFGSYHDVDSNENAFKQAGSMAFKEGMRKASPVLLEPMMAVEVETPEEYAGTIMSDLDRASFLAAGVDLDCFINGVIATADAVGAKRRSAKRIKISVDE